MIRRRIAAALAALVCTAQFPTPYHYVPPQGVGASLRSDLAGRLFMDVSSAGRPFSFDASRLVFSWQPLDIRGHQRGTAFGASLTFGGWKRTGFIAPPDQVADRIISAPVDLGKPPLPGLYPVEVGITVHGHACQAPFEFADAWQADVMITRARPPNDLTWSSSVRIGDSRARVRWIMGYPDQFGTADEFDQLDEWVYIQPPPSTPSVTFKNDRVIDYVPPKMMP